MKKWYDLAIPAPVALQPSEAVIITCLQVVSQVNAQLTETQFWGLEKQISSCKLAWYVLPRYELLVISDGSECLWIFQNHF